MKFYSKDLRERAVAAYKSGKYTQIEVADLFKIHVKSLQKWLKIDALGEEQIPKPKGFRPRILSSDDLQKLVKYIEENPDATQAQMRDALGKNCSLPVISRALAELGISYKKKRYAPASMKGKM